MFSRRIASIFVMAIFVVIAGAVSFSHASAARSIVIHIPAGGGCAVDDVEGNRVTPISPPRGEGVIVVTQSANGNWTAVCTGKMPEGAALPERTYKETIVEDPDGLCGIPGWIITRDWQQITTPSGQVQLTCHFPEMPAKDFAAETFGRFSE